MRSKNGSKPATQADVHRLEGRLDKVEARLDEKIDRAAVALVNTQADVQAVRSELGAAKAELKSEVAKLDKKIDRVAAALVNTQADVREIRHDMATRMATKDDIGRVLDAIDAFAQKAQTYDRAAVLHGQALTEVQTKVKDHDKRLAALESRS